MTTSSLRIVAAGIALIFAVLTGLFTGMAGGPVCTGTDQPSEQIPGQNQNEASPGTGRRDPGQGKSPDAEEQPGENEQPGSSPEQPGPGGGIPDNPDNESPEANPQAVRGEPLAVPAAVTCESGFSVPAALVGFFGALLGAAAVAGLFLVLGRRETVPAAAPRVVPTASGNGSAAQSEGERSTLVQTCIYVRDRATSKALADRLGWALQEVGVTTVAPTGARFDPAHHEAGGAAATTDPGKVGTVAAVEVPGYLDRGVVLRAPVVTVYRQDGS
ncbi:MAG: nucleotide exchange factor GrpE [Micromonosporaceae bacterium]